MYLLLINKRTFSLSYLNTNIIIGSSYMVIDKIPSNDSHKCHILPRTYIVFSFIHFDTFDSYLRLFLP